MKLLGFEYEIVYEPGKGNKVADTLSRKDGSLTLWLVKEENDGAIAPMNGVDGKAWEQIKEAVKLDERSQEILQRIEAIDDEIKHFKAKDGLILYKNRVYIPNTPELRISILTHFHHSKKGGHLGWFRTYARMKNLFFWEGMQHDVKNLVNKCDVCQKVKYITKEPMGLLQPLPILSMI